MLRARALKLVLSGCNSKLRGAFFWRFIQDTQPLKMLFSGPIGFPPKVHFCQSEGARVVLNYAGSCNILRTKNGATVKIPWLHFLTFNITFARYISRFRNQLQPKFTT